MHLDIKVRMNLWKVGESFNCLSIRRQLRTSLLVSERDIVALIVKFNNRLLVFWLCIKLDVKEVRVLLVAMLLGRDYFV